MSNFNSYVVIFKIDGKVQSVPQFAIDKEQAGRGIIDYGRIKGYYITDVVVLTEEQAESVRNMLKG
jgi:hypothetical protein